MDTTREWPSPSGSEVESAAWHPHGGMRGKLDTLKSRGIAKVHDVQRLVVDRKLTLQSSAKSQVTNLQESMRTSPMKWAGIAAGTGFALGLIGRIAQIRSRRRTPALVIVEASC